MAIPLQKKQDGLKEKLNGQLIKIDKNTFNNKLRDKQNINQIDYSKMTKKKLLEEQSKLNDKFANGLIEPIEFNNEFQRIHHYICQIENKVNSRNKKQKVSQSLSQEDVEKLKKMKKTPAVVISMLLINTGLRVSELCSLKWSDVEDTYIRVRKGKGNKYREIPLNEDADKALDWLSDKLNGKVYVLETSSGKKYARMYVNKMLHQINKAWFPHLLRHTFATILKSRGVDFKDIQTLMGHASIKTTLDIYCHPTMQDLSNAIKKI